MDGACQSFKAVRPRRLDDAAGMLEPVARAIVELLTDTPLALVRQCEAHDCTLMFHDRTKSHRRRWCSMALCGNRMKVAAFRSRKKESESD
ncbi:CGNR zinc finger domain-containing protein [Achromobacter xylosoxidans]